MVDYIHSLSLSDSHSLLSLCSWPLAIVTDNSDYRVTGFVMQRAPDRFRYIRLSGGQDISYASIQYLLVDDRRFKMYTSSQPLLYLEKLVIISKLAVALENLHGRGVTVGDLSPRNVLAALSPDYSIFFIDVDSMRFKGRSVSPQVETPKWQITRAFPGEELATIKSDCYKLALLSLRLLSKEIGTYQISSLPIETSFRLRSLIQSSLSQCAVTRPKIDTWTALLKPFSDCKQIAAEILLQANARLTSSAWDDAIQLFDRVIRLSSDSFDAYVGRSNAYCELGRYGDAIADLTRALQLKPTAPDLYNNRGYAKLHSGDKNGALDDFSREASNYPNSATAIYNRAWVKRELGDTVGSLSDLRRVTELDPNLLEGPMRQWAKDLLEQNKQIRQQASPPFSISRTNQSFAQPVSDLFSLEASYLARVRQAFGDFMAGLRPLPPQSTNPKWARYLVGSMAILMFGFMVRTTLDHQEERRLRDLVSTVESQLNSGEFERCSASAADLPSSVQHEALDLRTRCLDGYLADVSRKAQDEELIKKMPINEIKLILSHLTSISSSALESRQIQAADRVRDSLLEFLRQNAVTIASTEEDFQRAEDLFLIANGSELLSKWSGYRAEDKSLFEQTRASLLAVDFAKDINSGSDIRPPKFHTAFWKDKFDSFWRDEYIEVLAKKFLDAATHYSRNGEYEHCINLSSKASSILSGAEPNSSSSGPAYIRLSEQAQAIYDECRRLSSSASTHNPFGPNND
jgi:Tfp pilus assembly protein PilF